MKTTNLRPTCPRCGFNELAKITKSGKYYKLACSRCGCYIQHIEKDDVEMDYGPIQVSMPGEGEC